MKNNMVTGHDFIKGIMWAVVGFYKNSAINYSVDNNLSDADTKMLLDFGDNLYRKTEEYIRKI